LLQELDVEKPHVLGYSMGGAIAFQMAINRPEEIASLVIVNSVPSFRMDTLEKRFGFYLRLVVARTLGLKQLSKIVSGQLFPRPEHQALSAKMRARYADNDKHSYIAGLHALARWNVTDMLDCIACPVLVISADHDYFPVSAKEAYVRRLANARLEVVHDSRHGTPMDQPRSFSQKVLGFLAEVENGGV